MSVINIRKARREGARLVIGLAGVSGSGKTYTALQLAYGLANKKADKVGFIDTENRRGSLYADVLPEPFLIGDLYAPFSPARYIEAIHAFQKAGVEVLVIDSVTHEYEGIGGVQEIAEAGNPRLPNWNRAKAEHKRFMNALLTCDMHVIVCLRAREKAKPEKQMVNGQEKLVYIDLGLQPIQEKNFVYELTAGVMLHDAGQRQDVLKCPAELLPILGRGEGYLTAKDGQAIREWVDGAVQLDPKVENWRNRLISITERGQAYVEECWGKVPAAIQKALGPDFLAMLKASAAEYERQDREAREDAEGTAGALNDELGAAAAAAAAAGPVVEDPLAEAEAPAPTPANDNEPPPPAAEEQPAAKPARKPARRTGSNPPPPAGDKPVPPPNPPAPAKRSTDLF